MLWAARTWWTAPDRRPYGGAEASTDATIARDFHLDVQAGWLDPEYKVYSSVDSNRPNLGVIDLAGKMLAQTSKWTLSGGADYSWHPAIGDITIRAEAKYQSKMYFTPFNTERYSQDGYALVDLYLNYQHPDGHLSGGLFMKNVANKNAWASMTGAPVSIGGFISGASLAPRTFGVRLGYRL
nr:TonB-dependent receptor [Sphingobium chlorophenolicum]